jgi:ribokinase
MPAKPRIVVVGSSNTDMVARAPSLPKPGQTVLGTSFEMAAGGKGANQAVAAARLGGDVTFIARVGADLFGDQAVMGFEKDGIDTRYIVRDPDTPSGIALIGVDETTGENSIIVAPGANANLSIADIEAAADAIASADILVCQLEVPLETVQAALRLARSAGARTILNPAPALPLPPEILTFVSILTPNEAEAAQLAGVSKDQPDEAAQNLLSMEVGTVIITLGAEGALVADPEGQRHLPAPQASAVDTTAAGDCFNGALAVALGEGLSIWEAAAFACNAASISVTRAGAQPSLPYRRELSSD